MQKLVWLLGVSFIFVMLMSLNVEANMQEMKHVKTYKNKGTRSESIHGGLVIADYVIPEKFKKISYNGKAYGWEYKSQEWDSSGYMPKEYVEIEESQKIISTEMLKKGFYLGTERLKNTPDNWIFVSWGKDKNAFVSWKQIDALVKEYNVSTLDREMALNMRPLLPDTSKRKKITLK